MAKISDITYHSSTPGRTGKLSEKEDEKIERANDILYTKLYISGLANKGLYYNDHTFNTYKTQKQLPIFVKVDDSVIKDQVENGKLDLPKSNKIDYVNFQNSLNANKCVAIEITFDYEFTLTLDGKTINVNKLYIVPLSSSGGSLIMQLYKKYCK